VEKFQQLIQSPPDKFQGAIDSERKMKKIGNSTKVEELHSLRHFETVLL